MTANSTDDLTLALETSTLRGGVALYRGPVPVFSRTFTADRSHSADLFAVIAEALAPDLIPARIVVGLGPGSYAGVRISIAAAIGLSLSTGAELIGIPSITTLADFDYEVVGDARQQMIFTAHVRIHEGSCGIKLVPPPELAQHLTGLPLYSSDPLDLPGLELRFPSVDRLALLAVQGRFIHSRGALQPIYLRDPHITLPRAVPPC